MTAAKAWPHLWLSSRHHFCKSAGALRPVQREVCTPPLTHLIRRHKASALMSEWVAMRVSTAAAPVFDTTGEAEGGPGHVQA